MNMESDQNSFDQSPEQTKVALVGALCNNIEYKSKIVHRKYKQQMLPYLLLREHNLLVHE